MKRKIDSGDTVVEGLIFIMVVLIVLVGVFLILGALIGIVCWAFGWVFSWKYVLGLWAIGVLIRLYASR